MSLIQIILPPPTDHGFDEWTFNHWQHHEAIRWAAQQKFKTSLDTSNIWPVSIKDIDVWLRVHQDLHNAMNAVFKVQGNDLTTVDWRDAKQRQGFFFLNWQEHRSCAINSGLPI